MQTQEMAEAIRTCASVALDDLTRALWAGHAAGHFTDQDATVLAEAIQARRNAAQAGLHRPATNHRHRPQRPPERSVAIERRRRLAASGVMPPALAARFTLGELAVLRIVADEHRDRGCCTLCLDAIAARAGVSRSLAKGAIRQARRLGMVEVQERRRVGAKSLPNLVTVVDREWLAWLKRGARGRHHTMMAPGIGGRNQPTTDTRGFRGREQAAPLSSNRSALARIGRCSEQRIPHG